MDVAKLLLTLGSSTSASAGAFLWTESAKIIRACISLGQLFFSVREIIAIHRNLPKLHLLRVLFIF